MRVTTIYKAQGWLFVFLAFGFCLWGVGDVFFNGQIESCLQNGCTALTFDESPANFLFMLCVHLSVGYVAIKDAIKLVSRNHSQ